MLYTHTHTYLYDVYARQSVCDSLHQFWNQLAFYWTLDTGSTTGFRSHNSELDRYIKTFITFVTSKADDKQFRIQRPR